MKSTRHRTIAAALFGFLTYVLLGGGLREHAALSASLPFGVSPQQVESWVGTYYKRTMVDATPLPVNVPTPFPGASVRANVSAGAAPAVPCTDGRGCPDLFTVSATMQDYDWIVRNFNASNCSVQEGYAQAGDNLLLRFTYTVGNRGHGDLIIGAPSNHPEWFNFNNCHNHAHFREYADYRLWTETGYALWTALRAANPNTLSRDILAAHPELHPHLVAGRKLGFCSIDIRPLSIPGVPAPGPARYTSCDFNQGIGVSWADEYSKFLDGQWFDATNVPNGRYWIEAESNAEQFIEESDYSNNTAAILIDFNPTNRPPTRTPTSPTPTNTPASSSPTRTPTSTPSSPTPTNTPSSSNPTNAPSVTAISTPTSTAVRGGKNIGIMPGGQSATTILWDRGTLQSGYLVARYLPAFVLLPGGLQPPGATSVQDHTPATAPSGTLYCYILGPTVGTPPALAGLSNFACELANTRSVTGAPQSLTLRVTQSSNASLTWSAPQGGGQDGFRIVTLSGSTVDVSGTTGSRVFPLQGFDCFMVFAMRNNIAMGNADVVCGLAGVSNLGP